MIAPGDDHAAPTQGLGGPWGQYMQLPPELLHKFQAARVPPTRENLDKWAKTHRDAGNLVVPPMQIVDYYATAIAAVLSPIMLVVYILVWVLTLPAATIAQLYLLALPKPTIIFNRKTCGFRLLSGTLYLLTVPMKLVVIAYWCLLAVVIVPTSLLYAIVSLKIFNFKANWAALSELNHLPAWTWGDMLTGLMGAMWRQGFFEFYTFFPTLVVVVPVLKYLLGGANPLLYTLSTKYCNQWSAPLGFRGKKQTAPSFVFALKYPAICSLFAGT